MKRVIHLFAASILSICLISTGVLAQELLIPGGQIIGLELTDDTVTVAAFDDKTGGCAREAGLKIGDEIESIDGKGIKSVGDIRGCLESAGEEIELTVRREGKRHTFRVRPESTEDGPKLGVYLRQGIAGIGTVTYYDPETGEFGTLGHGVSDSGGALARMTAGNAYRARIHSVRKGKTGTPGQLKGSADWTEISGTLRKNTPQGVFGKSRQGWLGEPLPVADFEQVHTGGARIRSTVAGTVPQEYSVEILKIYPENRGDNRNFLLKVTDPELLAATGGIVQGMSGSPIIQDGKLVGAVTHVLVNDPTTGYGIFIENMLDAAA